MRRDDKLLNYCNRRKLPFTINLADLNDRAKLGYSTNGKRCSGLSKLLQRLADAGMLDYEGVLGKGVMIRSVSLVDEPASNQKLVSLFVEQTGAIVRDTATIARLKPQALCSFQECNI